jgi:hypothetical protein
VCSASACSTAVVTTSLASSAASWLRLSVADGSAVRPIVRELDHQYPSGPGMRLVEALADRWGVEELHGGTRVWFELSDNPDHTPADTDSVDVHC